MKYDVMILGAGASGLMAAVAAGRRGRSVLILEQKERPGKKLLATGNGKCNYTNRVQTPDCYRGGGKELALRLLQKFGWEETVAFFSDLGILPREKNGYFYPNSEQASSVAEVLRLEVLRTGGNFRCLERVCTLRKESNGFTVETVQEVSKEEKKTAAKGKKNELLNEHFVYHAPKVILAAGGMASPAQGSDGSGLKLAKALGHTIVRPLPALTQMTAEGKYLKTLAGVRVQGKGRLFIDQAIVTEETGEFLFTAYGISGIPILQMSRFAAQARADGKPVTLLLDFFPQFRENELLEALKQRYQRSEGAYQQTASEVLLGMLHSKLSCHLLETCKISLSMPAVRINEKQLFQLAGQMKKFSLTITGTNGFDQAQVMAGGVDVREVNPDTLESVLVKGLFCTGELLDVDGTCGGYNLQWAWTSGWTAGNAV